jgi:hypothetical protein
MNIGDKVVMKKGYRWKDIGIDEAEDAVLSVYLFARYFIILEGDKHCWACPKRLLKRWKGR